MMQLFHNFKRYILILFSFAKNSLAAQLEYRVNFFSGMFVEIGFMFAKLSYVILIYKSNVEINGMSPDFILMFIGTYTIMTGLYMTFYSNFYNISNHIKNGTLDILITKPVSLLFITSFQHIDFAMPIPNIIFGIIMLIIGWKNTGIALSAINVIGFILFIILGVILTYSIFLLPRLLSFWFISSNGVGQICDSIWDFNNMPMGIYNRVLQNIGTFLIPIFLITNLPVMFVKGTSKLYLIWGIIAPFLFLFIVILIWRCALRKYTSTSS